MQGECDAWSAKRRPARGFSRFAREFLGENGVLFIRHLIDIYGAICGCRGRRSSSLCLFAPVFSLLACRMRSHFVSRRASHTYGTMKATKNSAEIRAKRRRPWRSI